MPLNERILQVIFFPLVFTLTCFFPVGFDINAVLFVMHAVLSHVSSPHLLSGASVLKIRSIDEKRDPSGLLR